MKNPTAHLATAIALLISAAPLFSQMLPLAQTGWLTNEAALQGLTFGPPSTNGLRMACQFVPAKDTYTEGQCLSRHLFFQNTGKYSVLFATTQDGGISQSTDEQGRDLPRREVLSTGYPAPQWFYLNPGNIVEVTCSDLTVIGPKTQSDFLPHHCTWIAAPPGTQCHLTFWERITTESGQLTLDSGKVALQINKTHR